MADDVTLNAGSGGAVIATDEISSRHYQIVKLAFGALDALTIVAAGAGLPVETSLGKAEDAVHSSGDTGVMALAVRKDTAAALAGNDGDYAPLEVDANGNLHVMAKLAASQTLATVTTVSTVTAVTSITNAVVVNGGAGQTTDIKVTLDSEAVVLGAGSAAIGKLAANSGVDIGDVDVTSVPARAATTDTITAKLATDAIQNGTTALTPKFAAIACASSGDNTLVSAVNPKKIRVLALCLVNFGTAVNCYFTTGAGGTVIFGGSTNKIPLDKSGAAGAAGFILPFNPVGWFETGSNAALVLNLSAAQGVSGGLVYVEV